MLLVYDHDNVLHITNERGLRWNYDKADKPSFDTQSIFVILMLYFHNKCVLCRTRDTITYSSKTFIN